MTLGTIRVRSNVRGRGCGGREAFREGVAVHCAGNTAGERRVRRAVNFVASFAVTVRVWPVTVSGEVPVAVL